MIQGMYFIYSLGHNGQVFYIGRTMNLVKRYNGHLISAKKPKGKTAKYIASILDQGQLPTMNIIDYVNAKNAIDAEKTMIMAFSAAGQPITNSQCTRWNTYKPRNIPSVITTKDMRQIIQYTMQVYVHQYGQRNGIYNLDYPDNPFDNE